VETCEKLRGIIGSMEEEMVEDVDEKHPKIVAPPKEKPEPAEGDVELEGESRNVSADLLLVMSSMLHCL